MVRRGPDGETADVTPPLFNVRTLVHEYGGGAFILSDGVVYFSNFEDQRLYRQRPGQEPEPITPEAAVRYADAAMDSTRDSHHLHPGGPQRRWGGGHHDSQHWLGRDGQWLRAPIWPSLLCLSPAVSGRVDAGLALMGPSKHAVGRQRPVGRRSKGRTALSGMRREWLEETARPSTSRSGLRRGSSTSSPTGAAGGTSTDGRTVGLSPFTRWMRSLEFRSGDWPYPHTGLPPSTA